MFDAGVNQESRDFCPICGKESSGTCKCMRHDCCCENGHQWHTCTVHHKIVIGQSNHTLPTKTCTCEEE
jgi:hypothetical protein